MATYLKSALVPTDHHGGYLRIVGVRDLNTSGFDHEDTRYASAVVGSLGSGVEIDVLPAVSEPRAGSDELKRELENAAKGQLQLAESGEYGRDASKHYRDNYRRFTHTANMAAKSSLWLPHAVSISRNGRAFVQLSVGDRRQFDRGEAEIVLRAVDCSTGAVLTEERLPAANDGVASEHRRVWGGRGSTLSNDGSVVLARKYGGWRRDRPTAWFEECSPSRELKKLAKSKKLPVVVDGIVAQTDRYWLSREDTSERGNLIVVLEKRSLKTVATININGHAVSMTAAPSGRYVVLGMFGGAVWALSLETQKIRKFRPHIGCRREDWVHVSVADDESHFVSECNGQLVLTNLKTGVSVLTKRLENDSIQTESVEGVDTMVTILPTFSFLGNKLAVFVKRELHELSSNVDDYPDQFVSESGRPGARKPVRVSRKDSLVSSLSKARLSQHEDTVVATHSPAVVLTTKRFGKRGWAMPNQQHAPPLGASRMGGWPDLAHDEEWPEWQGRPMAFLCQIDLAEVHRTRTDVLLPRDGLLSFFLGCSDQTFDNDFDRRDQFMVELIFDMSTGFPPGWRVLYTPSCEKLERKVFDGNPTPHLFWPSSIKHKLGGKSLPDEIVSQFRQFPFDASERADYIEMIGQLQTQSDDNQLMGYPSVLQFTPPELYIEQGGFDFPKPDSDAFEKLEEDASKWMLLLQLTSDHKPDFLWGDGGHFYFYIEIAALNAGDFSNVRVFFEN